jgi:xanthine dehydrogenase accessory factor
VTEPSAPQSLAAILPLLAGRDLTRGGVAVATVVANRTSNDIAIGSRLIVFEGSPPMGSIHAALDRLLIDDALECLRAKRPRLRSYFLSGGHVEAVGIEGGDVDVYFEVLARPARLVIVGAGHIALPLARVGKLVDFEVVVVDDRPEFVSRERFPDADSLLVGPYQPTLAGVDLDGDTYVVLVTRGHVHDQACLELVLERDVAYVGMIGSKRRVRTVMAHARENGFAAERLQRVHAPIGVDIAAQTPAEIAIAIMAEIINVRRGGRAPSLALGERLRV